MKSTKIFKALLAASILNASSVSGFVSSSQQLTAGGATTKLQASSSEANDEWSAEIRRKRNLPKNSQSIPFLARPPALKGKYAGDVGFDPLGFAKNEEILEDYREAEIKHARLAMLVSFSTEMTKS